MRPSWPTFSNTLCGVLASVSFKWSFDCSSSIIFVWLLANILPVVNMVSDIP